MDASEIAPFVESAARVCSTSFQLTMTAGEPRVRLASEDLGDVTAVVDLAGEVSGSLALGFPGETADAFVSLFYGGSLMRAHPAYTDAMGEIASMIASGSTTPHLTEGRSAITTTTVALGSTPTAPAGRVIGVACDTDCGEFVMEFATWAGDPIAANDEPLEAPAGGIEARSDRGGSPRVLIVDDAAAMRRVERSVLRTFGDVQIEEASSGLEAIERAARFAPDLVVTDWTMPTMDGPAFVRVFRAIDPTTPIIAIAPASETARALEAGASRCIAKPFTPDKLSQRVAEALDAAT